MFCGVGDEFLYTIEMKLRRVEVKLNLRDTWRKALKSAMTLSSWRSCAHKAMNSCLQEIS